MEDRDIERVIGLLADDVVFHSPVVFRPYEGRDAVATVLRAIFVVAQDFRYVREIAADDGRDHALVFAMRVGDREVKGVDLITTGPDGRIVDLTVMMRPMSGLLAAAEAMRAQLEAAS